MFLAHYNSESESTQTYKEHSDNVGLLCSQFLSHLNLPNYGAVVGILHDMGKLTNDFNYYLNGKKLDEKLDHAFVGASYLNKLTEHEHDPFIRLTIQLISVAIMSHHTGLIDVLNFYGEPKYEKRLKKVDDHYAEAKENFEQYFKDDQKITSLLKKSYEEIQTLYASIASRNREVCKNRINIISFELGILQRIIFSALIDADRYDTSCFFMNKKIKATTLKPKWDNYINRLETYIDQLPKNGTINQLRNQISIDCRDFANKEQGVYQLYVPTGGGKTLASLRFALHHAKKHGKIRRIIYVIPFISILSQNADTLRKILFAKEEYSEEEFLEHYSSLIVKDEEEHKLYTERWQSNIILTTLVQFLNTAFLGKTQSARRMHQLSDAVIIFDEIQSLPPQITHMFNSFINFLSNVCHSTIVLCTATQPRLQNTPVPLQMQSPSSMISNYQELYVAFRRTQIIDMTRDEGYSACDIAKIAQENINTNQSALIVMNTKKEATKVFKQLQGNIGQVAYLYFLSTSLCMAHREVVLDSIHKKIKNNEKVICVSTSMIEAGVDLSFSFVIRACASLSSIAQAAGRCNRHGESELGFVYIVNAKDEKLSMLKDIEIGKQITTTMLDIYRKDASFYDYDLLSLKAMDCYFDMYYKEKEKVLDYPFQIERDKTARNLYDSLSGNVVAKRAFQDCNKEEFPYIMCQSYDSAGNIFKVIDNDMVDVIVPYEKEKDDEKDEKDEIDGKDIIAKLLSAETNFEGKIKLLRNAQRYSVGLYKSDIKKLGGGIGLIDELGVMYLNDTHYKCDLGVCMDGEAIGYWI